jgi:hypothetical protein
MQRMTCRAVVGVPCGLFVLAVLTGLLAVAAAPVARGQSDDFNDGDDAGWTRSSPLAPFGAGGAFTFPAGGYRIQAPASPSPADLGPGRAGSFLTGNAYTTFAVTVDVVNWDNALNQAFGVLARTSSLGLGTTNGYAFTYATNGSIDITRVVNEGTTNLATTGITLDPARDYRLVFTGDNAGLLVGSVYDLSDLATALATVSAADTTYASGFNGVFVFDNTAAPASNPADATFDNYFAAASLPVPEPAATAGAVAALFALALRRPRVGRRLH